ncbi:hypothetical protein GQ44DRAFT_769681 [Phaeosphaeriaceae sp. PMI808]|nr:hypothetical protein GQ44DRAFT_769681 [Phaeosphaeriaceae sp. PMI808]
MNTRKLSDEEMEKLVRVLRGSSPRIVKADIKELPSILQRSCLSISSNLCHTHRGLDYHLIDDIWAWIKHEFEYGIGRFIYPIIMSGNLSGAEEAKIRQLEPVLEMWCQEFRLETSAPPGRTPVMHGLKWKYEPKQCPACIIARIGSDVDILFALYAGMIGRFKIKKLCNRKVVLAETGVASAIHPRSKRVRFVQYWLRASSNGDAVLPSATEFGFKLKKLYREWNELRRAERPSIYGGQYSVDGSTHKPKSSDPFHDDKEVVDSKIGPEPRPNRIHCLSPLESLGMNTPAHKHQAPSTEKFYHPYSQSVKDSALQLSVEAIPAQVYSDSISSLGPDDSISVLLPISLPVSQTPVSAHRRPMPILLDPDIPSVPDIPKRRKRHKSATKDLPHSPKSVPGFHSSAGSSRYPSAEFSYDGGNGGVFRSFESFDYHYTHQDRFNKYKDLLTSHPNEAHQLPKPQRQSIYYGYGSCVLNEDPFGAIDEDEEEQADWDQ